MTNLLIRRIPQVDYTPCWNAMKTLTDQRDANTTDELWLLEHPPVFTLGQAGKPEHVLAAGDIPVVHCDRGGQVTYHAPGQLVGYLLFDTKRLNLGTRAFVSAIENTITQLLGELGLTAHNDPKRPGVYVNDRKIASLGLRIRRGCSYHGLALNHSMDLTPWQRINPCGYSGQAVTSLAAEGIDIERDELEARLVKQFCHQFGYRACPTEPPDWYNSATASA